MKQKEQLISLSTKRYLPTPRQRDQDDQIDSISTLHSSFTLQPYTKNPRLPQFNSCNHHKMRINAIFELPMTSKTKHLFPSSITKRKKSPTILPDSNDTSATTSTTNDEYTIVSSFSHDDFLKILEKTILNSRKSSKHHLSKTSPTN